MGRRVRTISVADRLPGAPRGKLYKPICAYDTQTLAKDFTAHVVYGSGTSAMFSALTDRKG